VEDLVQAVDHAVKRIGIHHVAVPSHTSTAAA
jgi:microsomal dipeptidase-like Zn-dependent dipeptidase